ncbi:hypothetical protein CERSUDRAFT_81309 [Gelatoporia subvermispora B]|uniref:Uncharacterized protein n=1 Tax=Ceriporiopsis subvermispora (strain B) TaxID=914234 RepID=M2PTG8_CERS8|nr:hypothetical protein CERSUDRAFT_81309 [Gelatoporia subvermispora B]
MTTSVGSSIRLASFVASSKALVCKYPNNEAFEADEIENRCVWMVSSNFRHFCRKATFGER